MAKVGILGQRRGEDGIKTTDYRPSSAAEQQYVFKVVYKVPTDVKMAVVDVDLYTFNDDAYVDISPAYTNTPVITCVLAARVNRSASEPSMTLYAFQRKCLVLGPGDTVFFKGPTDSNCVVTGIEHV